MHYNCSNREDVFVFMDLKHQQMAESEKNGLEQKLDHIPNRAPGSSKQPIKQEVLACAANPIKVLLRQLPPTLPVSRAHTYEILRYTTITTLHKSLRSQLDDLHKKCSQLRLALEDSELHRANVLIRMRSLHNQNSELRNVAAQLQVNYSGLNICLCAHVHVPANRTPYVIVTVNGNDNSRVCACVYIHIYNFWLLCALHQIAAMAAPEPEAAAKQLDTEQGRIALLKATHDDAHFRWQQDIGWLIECFSCYLYAGPRR